MTPRAEAMVVWRCPECGSYRVPDGTEAVYGPPECSHGLMFGSTPDGGGEVEMERIEVVPAADYERALDALENLYTYGSGWYGKLMDARRILRAAGRLDG